MASPDQTHAQRPSGAAASDLGDRTDRHQQALRPGPRQPGHPPADPARHRARHRRRKRRRQIDADVDPLRLLHRRQRRNPRQRQAAQDHRFPPCPGARHRHGAPALHAGRQFHRPRERRPRRRGFGAARPHADQGPRRSSSGSPRDYGLEVDPDAIIEDLSVGQQQRVEILKALYRGADIAHSRRAHRRADARPRPTTCSASSARCATRARPSSSSPTSCARSWRSPTRCRSCARARWSRR